jgi:hypothetical protein
MGGIKRSFIYLFTYLYVKYLSLAWHKEKQKSKTFLLLYYFAPPKNIRKMCREKLSFHTYTHIDGHTHNNTYVQGKEFIYTWKENVTFVCIIILSLSIMCDNKRESISTYMYVHICMYTSNNVEG